MSDYKRQLRNARYSTRDRLRFRDYLAITGIGIVCLFLLVSHPFYMYQSHQIKEGLSSTDAYVYVGDYTSPSKHWHVAAADECLFHMAVSGVTGKVLVYKGEEFADPTDIPPHLRDLQTYGEPIRGETIDSFTRHPVYQACVS